MILEFPAPGPLLNMNDRRHHMKQAHLVREWRRAAFIWGIKIGRERKWTVPLGPSTVKLTLPVRSLKTRRDPSNWAPTAKACIDGLTDAGYWPDDNSKWVTVLEPEFWTGSNVVVDIWPREEP